jgi:Flp pilus assembly protein TadG
MDAQAVIETAIVIPVLLALISAFLAVMVQVSAQQEMDAATKLAAESFFQAPRLATDSIGTTCCPQSTGAADSLDTSGMPKGCRFAAETFYGTMAFRRYLAFAAQRDVAAHPLCRRDGAPIGDALRSFITCDIDAVDTALNPPQGLRVVRCAAHATLDFSHTPLAWAVVWNPTVAATAEAIPPPFRQ